MITIKQEEKLLNRIKGLSELEFSSLLREMAEHIRRNNWESMIDECFDIDTFEHELDEMTESRDHWLHRAKKAEETINQIRDLL